ncbi:MAG: Isochorismate synthase @ Menaquinone-specific isochorismate synthase [uncultured Acidimicrobiales bacterium]|uniref:isochorismate synthase n=1 Tax=uncultured Acidimicrobiales bacterium TaxID=310071 RepID=A0A6J4H1C4_9ACTN|nr:MAG: Isochorismate synthase @ Menaquinone-specific isochorismate synthase [uncultured Acidimicrobiales bacterium]
MTRSATHVVELVATTTRLDDDVDLLACAGDQGWLFESADHGLAGRGEALRITLPPGAARAADAAEAVAHAFTRVEVADEVGRPGTGPVAFAALPFDDEAQATAVVPALVVGRAADGTRWVTRTRSPGATDDTDDPLAPGRRAGGPGPSRFDVSSTRSPESWCRAVVAARDRIRAGELTKVVLAREVVVEADAPISPVEVLGRLRAAYPSAYRFSVDGFIGASPELLVSRAGDIVRSQPMAGTAARSGDPSADARLAASLLASAKDLSEHRITIDAVLDTLLPFCSYVDAEAEPSVVAVANVQHLATLVHGRLSSPPANALSLATALHPTPAVGGAPRHAALAVRAELEQLDRGRYAGPVGWVDAAGNGTFAVGVRSAEIDGRRARVFAGNGMVADSDPAAELSETRAKLLAMLSAIVRP